MPALNIMFYGVFIVVLFYIVRNTYDVSIYFNEKI